MRTRMEEWTDEDELGRTLHYYCIIIIDDDKEKEDDE